MTSNRGPDADFLMGASDPSTVYTMGTGALLQGQLELALKRFSYCEAQYLQAGDLANVARCKVATASVWRNRREYGLATSLLQEAINLYETAGDSRGLAEAYRDLAYVTASEDGLKEEYLLRSIDAARSSTDQRLLASLLDSAVGSSYYALPIDQVREFAAEAVELYRQQDNESGLRAVAERLALQIELHNTLSEDSSRLPPQDDESSNSVAAILPQPLRFVDRLESERSAGLRTQLEPLLALASTFIDQGTIDDPIVEERLVADRNFLQRELYHDPAGAISSAIAVSVANRIMLTILDLLPASQDSELARSLLPETATENSSDPRTAVKSADQLAAAIETNAQDLPKGVSTQRAVAAYLGWVELVSVGGGTAGLLALLGVSGPPAVIVGACIGILSWTFRSASKMDA